MFFQCPKCKKTWAYPIEKCPDCFLNLERVKSKKIKVIGVAKVQIPSIFHQKTPYFILVLEDENKNRWIQKSFEEYKIGQEFKIEKVNDKEGVVILRVKYDFLEAIEEVFEIFNFKIDSQAKVLILPTLVSASHPYFRENTSPEFLEATIKYLLQNGVEPQNIKVCSQSFDEIDIGAKAAKSGLLEVCQREKVIPFDLSQGNFVKKENLEISEEVFKSDLILNLPILKMGKAQASENLFFLLKKENYFAQEYLSSKKEIFENLKKFLPLIFTLAETRHIQDQEGFTKYLNLIFASFNSQNLDRVFFEITKKGQLPEILKEIKIEKIPIFGRKIEEVKFYAKD
jgi:uncharacterized OB-fold protein